MLQLEEITSGPPGGNSSRDEENTTYCLQFVRVVEAGVRVGRPGPPPAPVRPTGPVQPASYRRVLIYCTPTPPRSPLTSRPAGLQGPVTVNTNHSVVQAEFLGTDQQPAPARTSRTTTELLAGAAVRLASHFSPSLNTIQSKLFTGGRESPVGTNCG